MHHVIRLECDKVMNVLFALDFHAFSQVEYLMCLITKLSNEAILGPRRPWPLRL